MGKHELIHAYRIFKHIFKLNTKSMNEKIDQIRLLLITLENELESDKEKEFSQNFNALELPSIISSIVDFLDPLLTPNQLAVYWYLFNNSIIKTGTQYTRASTNEMRRSVAKSGTKQVEDLGSDLIRKAISF